MRSVWGRGVGRTLRTAVAVALVSMLLGAGPAEAQGKPEDSVYNKNSSAVVLKIEGKTVRKVGEVEVGAFAEGVVFSRDGKYVYAGNFVDRDVSILKVEGSTVTNTGKRLTLPGRPASMRGRAR